MHVSTKSYPFIKTALTVLIIIGCAEISAQPEVVKPVTIMVGEQGPDGCELLGKIKGSSKDDATDAADDNTPYVDRLIKARNNLRHETQKLGGNNVHIIRSNNTGKYEIPGVDKEIILIGNVYRCE
ncbi:uncharacterized protein DUF4156 [Nitrosomonas sp. Nm84]|uniref:DUF4156 domain-containing protein n=1 Tax=Nitrosomonas sp. Nm84 TaxID=200124 RepID=UPI000D760D29|nr:DUF4156 domain-containing protein [Nitrosomonas sp. Nm84]PXW85191.1 uncharacterized protein DUF4156 [Nitrosomonas sp. Nm84]